MLFDTLSALGDVSHTGVGSSFCEFSHSKHVEGPIEQDAKSEKFSFGIFAGGRKESAKECRVKNK